MIPADKINLTQSLLYAYYYAWGLFGAEWMGVIMAICIVVGVFAQASTWIAGPSRGLLAVGKAGYLPLWFQKTNKYGVQINILILQAIIVTLLCLAFVIFPSVQSAFQVLSVFIVLQYLTMYGMMFA